MRALLCALALVAACESPPSGNTGNQQPPDPEVPDPTEHVAKIQFAPGEDAANRGEFKESFTLLGQEAIWAVIDIDTADVEPIDDVFFMRFNVVTSAGSSILTKYSAFSYGAGAPETAVHPVTQRTLKVQKVTSDNGWVRQKAIIRVAGSAFTKHQLQGEFFAEVRLGVEQERPQLVSSFRMGL